MFTEGGEKRFLRILMLMSLAVIIATMVSLLELASVNTDFDSVHIKLFIASCVACLYILGMTYYAKAQRDKLRRANEEKYRSIIAISDMGAWEFHSDTGYVWCSPEYFQMLGYEEETFLKEYNLTIETLWLDLLHPEDRKPAVDKFAVFASGLDNSFYENTFRMKHRKGNWIWVLSRSKPLPTAGRVGKVLLGSHIDISEKISIQIELRKRNQKLVNFAFSNAHHVRGPVARMLGLLRLVQIDTEASREWYVNTISNEVRELDKITKSISRELEEIEELVKER